ncbi:MAG: isochorismatase family protein [Acidobacteriota bacterium]|nr:isochorismatase family protein [Acidobacteriota bacterium]MDQ7087469.1 isochorismatase family protein [Acidobacteriota bacterium]
MPVELLDASRSLLLVIDLQGKLMEMIERPDLVVAATRRLMQIAEIFEVPVLLTEQYPEGLGPTHPAVRETFDALQTPKSFLAKTSFGCCGDDGFQRTVDELLGGGDLSRRQIVVAGIEAHICVMQTTIELLRSGHQVHLCWECVSSRGAEYRRHALDRMQQAGAQLTNHESVGFEWARDAGHPRFRRLNRLLRQGQLT